MSRIVLIEDDTALRTALLHALEGVSHKVATAPDGRAGLDRVHEFHPELVITDLNMPDMDGFEIIEELHRKSPCLPVIAMSGGGYMSQESLLEVARLLGARAILEKPFLEEKLTELVAELLLSARCPPHTPSVTA